jgi:Ca2+/H+ antiporter, TMEM165/GDT1 family
VRGFRKTFIIINLKNLEIMYCCGEKRGAGFWIKRAIFIPIAIAAGIFLFGFVVMSLWNCLLPSIIGVGTITFWQALGILILSKILFGGFRGGPGHHHNMHKHGREWHRKWMNMTPEEREKMKAEWRGRCGSETKNEEPFKA